MQNTLGCAGQAAAVYSDERFNDPTVFNHRDRAASGKVRCEQCFYIPGRKQRGVHADDENRSSLRRIETCMDAAERSFFRVDIRDVSCTGNRL